MPDTRLATFSYIIYLILMVNNSKQLFRKQKKFYVLKGRLNKFG